MKSFTRLVSILVLLLLLSACEKTSQPDPNAMAQTLKDFGYVPLVEEDFYQKLEAAIKDSKGQDIELVEDDGQVLREFRFNQEGDLTYLGRWNEVDPELISCINRNNMGYDQYIDFVIGKYVPEDYSVKEVEDFTQDLQRISFYRKNQLDVKNPYDSYHFVFHPSEKFVVMFQRVDEFILEDEPKISKEEAEEIAQEFLEKREPGLDDQVNSIQLAVKSGNQFFNEGDLGNAKGSEEIYLIYEVNIGDKFVYVNALDGEIVGGDEWAD